MLFPSLERSEKSDPSAKYTKYTQPPLAALQIKGLKILLCCVFSLMLIFLHTDLPEDLAYIPLLKKAIKTISLFFSPSESRIYYCFIITVHGTCQIWRDQGGKSGSDPPVHHFRQQAHTSE